MESEWDVLAEIKAALDALAPASQPTFAHFKGYQDRTRPKADVPLQAQLNCAAQTKIGRETIPAIPTDGSFNSTNSSYRRLSTTLSPGNNYPWHQTRVELG
jgi:hypothetical protein